MKILKISSKNLNKVAKEAIDVIKKGGVVICPTDTVYGLITDATNHKSVERVFRIKKRKREKPIPVFVKDIDSAKEIAILGTPQKGILSKNWPGRLTAVLAKREKCNLPKILFTEEETIGLRIPDYELVNILLEKLNVPLTGTSANISGRPSSTKINKILVQFENQKELPDLIIDAGDLEINDPSTVVDLTTPKPRVLRIGSAIKIHY